MSLRKPPKPKIKREEDPIIPYGDLSKAPEPLKSMLDSYINRIGFLPNTHKLYVYRPEIAQVLFAFNNSIMRDASSTLDLLLKRKLSAVASSVNGCVYCTVHTCHILKRTPGQAGAEGWGLPEEQLQSIIDGTYSFKDEFEKVCFDFVRAASQNAKEVSSELLRKLRDLLTPPQIVELACLVGFWKFYNTVHNSLKIPIESHLIADTGYADLVPSEFK